MKRISFYNHFHDKTFLQKKIIKDNNFTYYLAINFLQPYIKSKTLNILDYGCGSGTLSYYYASKNNFVVGTDISEKALNINRGSTKALGLETNCKFIKLTDLNAKEYKGFFDLVLCSEVIEHIDKEHKLISSIYKLLKKDGLIFISTPSRNAPLYRLGLLNSFDLSVGHIRRYTLIELNDLLSQEKFEIIKYQKIEGIIRNSLFTINKLGWIIRFIRGPLSNIVIFLDMLVVRIFGESNILILARKS